MVTLKKHSMKIHQQQPFTDQIGSPCEGHEQEFLIDQLKSLQSAEDQLEKAQEKLIMRCPEFNNKEALKLFDPPEDLSENLHFFNIKKALSIILPRYCSL